MWPRIPRRLLSFALALTLATVVAGLGATSFQRKVGSFQVAGVTVEAANAGWRVLEVDRPGTGLRADDVVLLVHGQQPESRDHLFRLLGSRDEGEALVQRGGVLEQITYRRPAPEIAWPYLLLAVIGVFYLMVGLYTGFKDAHGRARLFTLWCATSAALYILSPILPPADPVDEAIFLVDQLARVLLPSLTLHLFLVFPTPLLPRSWRFVLGALYVPAAFSAAFYADQLFAGGDWWFGPATALQQAALDRLELIFLAACSLAAVLTLVVRFRRRPGWEHRRQVQWILAGLVGGYAPFVVLYLLPFTLGFRPPQWSTLLAVAPLVLVPLGFAYAILKYKLLDLELVLRDVVASSAAVLVGLFGFQLVHLAIQRGIDDDLALTRNVLTFAAGLAFAGVLVPTRRAVVSGLERLQHGGRLGQRHALRQLGRELMHERQLDRLCAELIERLSDALVVRVDLYLTQGRGLMVPVRPRPGLPRVLADDTFGDDFWQRQVESISAIDLPGEGMSAQQRLFTAGYRYAFPITVRGHHLGLAVTSYKFDDEPLNGEDLDLVCGLLAQAGLAIENAQLLEEVNHQLQEVTRLEAYNKGILESSPAGIAVLDAEARVASCNHAFAAVCDRPRADLLGRPIGELLPVRPLPEPGAGPLEVAYCEGDGEERYLQLSTAVHQGGTGEAEKVLVVQDVSERVLMELELKEKERLASLGMLAAGVAHEVNTPLTGISSYAQFLMADTAEDDPRHEILKKMERQTFRAAQIVNNLLELARNRRGEMTKVRLDAVAEEALKLLEERAAAAGVRVDWSPPAEPADVLGAEGELHQVVTNLVVNALDALAGVDGERRLSVAVEPRGRSWRLRLSDTGPGIPAQRLETVFKPFFSSKLGHGGSGLGLAICHGIVQRHGGEIRVENHDDGTPGCTFTVDLPAYGAVAAS